MKHHFKNTCYDIDDLLVGCKKMSTFMNKLRKQSYLKPDNFDPDKYFGDGFEAFVESLIAQQGLSKKIMIRDYTPISEDDLGVDGFGYGPNGEIHTVQAKARSNSDSVLTANKDHISNFVAHSHSRFGGESKVKYMTIFTTADDLHNVTREMYNQEVRVIGWKELRKLVDNNDMFWAVFRDDLKYGNVSD
jgi:hypothetical protein